MLCILPRRQNFQIKQQGSSDELTGLPVLVMDDSRVTCGNATSSSTSRGNTRSVGSVRQEGQLFCMISGGGGGCKSREPLKTGG